MSGCRSCNRHGQTGFSYVEMLIATVIVLASLGPAIDSLQIVGIAAEVHASETALHYAAAGRMEEVLAEAFGSLTDAADAAGSPLTPSSYSDPLATPNRIVVYLSYYDVADSDGDGDFFTIADANADVDNNPYTGAGAAIDVLWVRVATPGTTHVIDSLSAR